jgi:CRISPR-associated protein Cas1
VPAPASRWCFSTATADSWRGSKVPSPANVLLRRAQYRASEQPAEIVRSLVLGKVANQRVVLMRALRDHGADLPEPDRVALDDAVGRLARILERIEFGAAEADALRGVEGDAARLYFSVFAHLLRAPDPEIVWRGRSRRPPLDPVNAVLSFLYTLLAHDCRSAAEAVGLDPAVGFLHRDRPGRPSLALDLMEELRPALADRLALSLFNRRQLRAADFETRDGGAVMLTDEARKTVLTAWQERKKEERQHAFLGEKAPLGLVPYLQALLLARHLRGDLDAYPPWFWK